MSEREAPYNEHEREELPFSCDITQTLSRRVTIKTTDYVEEPEPDYYETIIDTKDTDWGTAYKENDHLTIPDLLDELKQYVEEDMKTCAAYTGKAKHLKHLLGEINEWKLIETEYEQC